MECYQETLTELNQVIEQSSDDAKAIAHRGESYRLTGHFEAALADFNRAIELNPTYAWAIAHRGETYYLIKRYEEALADFNRAIKLTPDYTWALAHRGGAYRFMGKHYYKKALADFSQAIELKSDYAWALAYRCQLYVLMNRYEEALVDCDRANAIDKTIIPSWPGERGLLLSYLGRYAEVIKCCEQVLQENPDDYITLYTFVVVKVRWRGLIEARPEIDKTRAVLKALVNGTAVNSTTRAGILYRLGGLAALEGYNEQALDYLQKAISLENEPLELARRDIAWIDLLGHPHFQWLIEAESPQVS